MSVFFARVNLDRVQGAFAFDKLRTIEKAGLTTQPACGFPFYPTARASRDATQRNISEKQSAKMQISTEMTGLQGSICAKNASFRSFAPSPCQDFPQVAVKIEVDAALAGTFLKYVQQANRTVGW